MKTTIELSGEEASALKRFSEARDISPAEVIHQALAHFLHGKDEDAEAAWANGVAREWAEELNDPREDIYSLTDGEPIDEGR